MNGKILGVVEKTTLPNALETMKHLNPIENFKISIICYYF